VKPLFLHVAASGWWADGFSLFLPGFVFSLLFAFALRKNFFLVDCFSEQSRFGDVDPWCFWARLEESDFFACPNRDLEALISEHQLLKREWGDLVSRLR